MPIGGELFVGTTKMSENPETLAPWAHPKAQEWIKLVLEKSELINEFEKAVLGAQQDLPLHDIRLLSMLAVLLGHPQIWPEERRASFVECANRLNQAARALRERDPLFAKSFEPKAAKLIDEDLQVEIEMLRRRGGLSRRINPLQLPHSWKRFWN